MAKRKTLPVPDNNNNNDNEVGLHIPGKEVERRLLEAGSQDELDEIREVLRAEGVPVGTISGTVAKLRKKGQLIFQMALAEVEEGGVLITHPLPVEALISHMKLPALADGDNKVFDAGVDYATRMIIGGVRIAQELSRMGIAQASPVIRMAAEMRKAEGMSAQEAGQVAAENALAGAIQYLSQQKPEKADIATVQNPLQGMVARMIEQMFSRMMGMGQGQSGPQGQPGMQLPPNWTFEQGEQSASE